MTTWAFLDTKTLTLLKNVISSVPRKQYYRILYSVEVLNVDSILIASKYQKMMN